MEALLNGLRRRALCWSRTCHAAAAAANSSNTSDTRRQITNQRMGNRAQFPICEGLHALRRRLSVRKKSRLNGVPSNRTDWKTALAQNTRRKVMLPPLGEGRSRPAQRCVKPVQVGPAARLDVQNEELRRLDRKSTRLNSSHLGISY